MDNRREFASADDGSVHEPVAEATHGDEMLRMMRIAFDFLPDPLHVDVQRLRVPEVVGAPYLSDKAVPGQQPAVAADQRLEQLELLGGEADDGARDPHLMTPDVDPDRTGRQDVLSPVGNPVHLDPPEVRADARNELPHRERLRDV